MIHDADTAELETRIAAVQARLILAVAERDGLTAMAELRRRCEAADERAAAARDPDGPMAVLARDLELTDEQVDFLWAAVAVSAEPAVIVHVEALAGAAGRRGLPLSLFTAHLGRARGAELALWLAQPNALTGAGLVACVDAAAPPAARVYAAPARLIAHLRGDDTPAPRLRRVAPDAELVLDDAQTRALERLGDVVGRAGALVVVEGPAGTGRTSAIARAAGRTVVVLDAMNLGPAELADGLVELWREEALTGALPVIADVDGLAEGAPRVLAAALERRAPAVVLTSRTPGVTIGTDRALVRVPWPVPDVAARLRLWSEIARPTDAGAAELELLAMRYRVGPGAIARAVASARLVTVDEKLSASALADGLRHNIAEQMGGLAHRVEVTQTWDDLVLADDIRDQVQALIARVRHGHHVLERWGYRAKMARGIGVPALFAGPPGTGKTMVAGLVARELDLELYQVDLSQVVSKWVGETEKQLARVFDAAEQGHALLLFDEADALFGQRTQDVKGAVDRYANLEVNFLLQRIEAFGGITILTTNLDASIDRALKRRLAAHIVFDLPDEEERALLWRRLTATARAPLAEDVDAEGLAREFPKMSGANIRNAALAAAFLAAADGAEQIGMAQLQRAARAEYRSMGHILAERRR